MRDLTRPRWLRGACIATQILAVVLLLCVTANLAPRFYGLDSDAFTPAILWKEIVDHGVIDAVTQWMYTKDNWLFLTLPFHCVGFWLFGTGFKVISLSGWMLFVGNAVVTAIIAWQLGARKGVLLLFAAMLCFGSYMWWGGYIGYPVTHNMTNLYGLLSISLMIQAIKTRCSLCNACLVVILTLGAVSDPWMMAAYNLPIVLTVLSLAFLTPGKLVDRRQLALAMGLLLSLLLAKTTILGLLSFLPSYGFHLGHWNEFSNNAVWLVKDLGGLMNLIPFKRYGNGSNAFIGGMISIVAFAELTRYLMRVCVSKREGLPVFLLAYLACALLSICGMTAAFVVGDSVHTNMSGRLLINIPYLFAITIFVLAEKHWVQLPRAVASMSIVCPALFAVSGLISNHRSFKPVDWSAKESLLVTLQTS